MAKFLAALLLMVVVVAQGAQVPLSPNLQKTSLFDLAQELRSRSNLGLSATINEYVDETVSMLVPFMQENGLDPMPLPDVIEGFSVRPVLITYSAWLKIYDGYMTGLEYGKRYEDQTVNYFAKMLRVRVQLEYTDLKFDYKYLVTVMNLGPSGGIAANLARLVVTADILVDFNNDEIHLQEFSFTEVGRLSVRLTGNILTDWLVNPVMSLFVTIFDTIVIKSVEQNIRQGINDGISIINSGIKDTIQSIEAL